MEQRQTIQNKMQSGYQLEYEIYRPLLDWNVDKVFEIHRRHNIQANPLYKFGAMRVGCFPCIYSSKNGLTALSRFPEHVKRVREWEALVNSIGTKNLATLIPHSARPDKSGIDNAVKWSKTTTGGKQYRLEVDGCMNNPVTLSCSEFGVCE